MAFHTSFLDKWYSLELPLRYFFWEEGERKSRGKERDMGLQEGWNVGGWVDRGSGGRGGGGG